MKTIILVAFLMATSVVPVYAQGGFNSAFDSGVRMAIEAERLRMQRALTDQQIELMRQQAESIKQTRKDSSNELFQKGFQDGYWDGYKKGLEDMTNNPSIQIQNNILRSLGNGVFNETSTEKLTEARRAFSLSLNTSDHYIAKLYITLIDARIEELRQSPK